MSVVVDASTVIAALTATGTEGSWAEELVAAHTLYAPELLLVETTNVLRRLEAASRLTTAEANLAHADLLQLDLQLFPFEPFAERVWMLRHALSSYDAWYIAIAEGLDFPLATLDSRLARSKGPKCRFLTVAP